MPTVEGSFTRDSSNRFTAVFDVDGTSMSFTANVTPAIESFEATEVTLTYDDVDHLTSKRSYHGRIGPGSIKLTIQNGPVIDGTIDGSKATGYPRATVVGSGTWEAH
ncbi:hypothetical protein C8Q75DRAFT_326778 [Abortiporus biennis]|nr:hypothetical protein C8Q75DRAFT_326778 [Abortiporus biennis]